MIIDAIIFPFKGLRNFLKTIFILLVIVYMLASLFVIVDYLHNEYGYVGKFFCSISTKDRLKASVVRVVGGYSEGTGFFIAENKVLTNFHVIADEPSPKIIFPDGSFITPVKIVGDETADLAVLITAGKYPEFVMPLSKYITLNDDEPVLASGYPMGTDLKGPATVLRGNYIEYRHSKKARTSYIQTDISLVEGMSGGPMTDICGKVMGVNTLGVAGLSMFISGPDAYTLAPKLTDQNISKITVDPSKSPEDAVTAFYTYIKARRMKEGFALLSHEYVKGTSMTEWTNRFLDILDVDIIKSEKYKNTTDTAFVKFSTKNWVDQEVDIHNFEGTWQTVYEDGVYKMHKSNIKEVFNPSWDWFYE